MVDRPSISMLVANTMRTPYLSESHPTSGDAPVDARPPALAAPAMSVRLQPSSSEIGKMKTARVRLAAALRTNNDEPAAYRMTHP